MHDAIIVCLHVHVKICMFSHSRTSVCMEVKSRCCMKTSLLHDDCFNVHLSAPGFYTFHQHYRLKYCRTAKFSVADTLSGPHELVSWLKEVSSFQTSFSTLLYVAGTTGSVLIKEVSFNFRGGSTVYIAVSRKIKLKIQFERTHLLMWVRVHLLL